MRGPKNMDSAQRFFGERSGIGAVVVELKGAEGQIFGVARSDFTARWTDAGVAWRK